MNTNLNTVESEVKNSFDIGEFLSNQIKSMEVGYKETDNLDGRDTVFNRDVRDIFSGKTGKKLLTLHIEETESSVTLSLIEDPEVMKNKKNPYNLRPFDRNRSHRGLGTKIAFLTMLYCIFKKKSFFAYPSTSGSNYWKKFNLPRDATRLQIQILPTNPKIEAVLKYVMEELMIAEETIRQNRPMAKFGRMVKSAPQSISAFIKTETLKIGSKAVQE